MLKVKDIKKYLEGVDPEAPVVIHDGNRERAWECDYAAYYTKANLYDDENDIDPAITTPYDGNGVIDDYAAQEHGVLVLSSFLYEHSRMLVAT